MSDTDTRNGLTFAQWKRQVNRAIGNIVGLTADDLPDIDYWHLWDDGVDPAEAATEALDNAGWEGSDNG